MPTIARTDSSIVGRWWWTVDRWTLTAIAVLAVLGTILVAAASPPVAARLNLEEFHFVRRHIILLGPAMLLLVGLSLADPRTLRAIAIVVLIGAIVGLVATLMIGVDVKGAQRWIRIAGFSLQPSEFAKPAFAIVSAWLFTLSLTKPGFPGKTIAAALFGLLVALLLMQPDLGQTVVLASIWFAQYFLAGMPVFAMLGLAMAGVGLIAGAYMTLPHVTARIDRFIDPASGDSYQIDRSLQAFANGGVFGTGPGEGWVKSRLPDAHADFVFSVAGEEFGLIGALTLLILIAFIVIRALGRAIHENDLFTIIAAGGLVAQFGLQALIHMGSTLQLMPTKGMTLPFVSYGGSSLLAVAFSLGAILALTRRHSGEGRWT